MVGTEEEVRELEEVRGEVGEEREIEVGVGEGEGGVGGGGRGEGD